MMGTHKSAGAAALALLLFFANTVVASYPEYFNRTAAKSWSQAEKVVRVLGLRKGQVVADIGAGGGYFAVLLARAVGPTGRVYASDISKACLSHIRSYAARRGVRNVQPVQATATDPGLKPGSIDLIFMRNTYHHISGRVVYFRRLKQVLKPGARVAIIDYYPRIHPNHSTRQSTLYREMARAGYRLRKRHTFLTRQHYHIFVVK